MLEYCKEYHKHTVTATGQDVLDDLFIADPSELVWSLSDDRQEMVGLAALEFLSQQQAQHRGWRRHRASITGYGLAELREEIMQRKCTVMLNNMGELERVTADVAVKIQRNHDELMVQLSK